MAANYDNVNAVWPDNPAIPTPQEALTGARKLARLALSLGPSNGGPRYTWHHASRMEFRLTSGNRYTWTRRGVFYVNPDQDDYRFRGWKGICHDIAHWAGRKLYPGTKPHDHRTAFIERKLCEHVVNSGWLDGKLKRPQKPKVPIDRTAVRVVRIDQRIASGSAKPSEPRSL
jgi:hypothetical protein